jgi:hypothetical protein
MLLSRPSSLLLLALVAAGCGGPGTTFRVVDVVNADGSFGLKNVELTTLTDVDGVNGDVATFLGSSVIQLDSLVPMQDRGGARAAFVPESSPVHINYIVDDGVVVGSDFDSLMMLTAYAHFETATLHFQRLGVNLPISPPPVDYNPTIKGGTDFGFPKSDNAAYFVPTDSFVLLPMRILQDIPFAMNTGVIAHEMSHRVFYYQAWGGQLFAAFAGHANALLAQNNFNRAKATDEGLADFFAASVTGDPLFLAKSTPGYVWEERDLTQLWVLNASWLDGIEPEVEGTYNPYAAGTVLGSALWQLSQLVGVETTELAVVAAELSIASPLVSSFSYEFGQLESEIVRLLPTSAQPRACAIFGERYMVAWSKFAGVCP